MPPQDEKNSTAVEGAPASNGSYWDAPPEQKLEGKTLSTLSLTGLETVEKEVAPKSSPSGGYWDELQQGMKKTLSKLNISDLRAPSRPSTATTSTEASTDTVGDEEAKEDNSKGKMAKNPSSGSFWLWRNPSLSALNNHPDIQEASKEDDTTTNKTNPISNPAPSGGYWDEMQQGMKKTLSKLSMSDLRSSYATSNTAASTAGEEETKEKMAKNPSLGSFWFWRNPSLSDLNNHPEIQEATKEDGNSTNKTNPISNLVTNRRPSGTGGYWFWRNPSATNLTEGQQTDSEADVDAMAKKAKESDRIEGQQGPISNMQHRMRTSWRASFQKLSTNSLTALAESGAAAEETKTGVAAGWKEEFSDKDDGSPKRPSGKPMTKKDSFLVQEEGEDEMEF